MLLLTVNTTRECLGCLETESVFVLKLLHLYGSEAAARRLSMWREALHFLGLPGRLCLQSAAARSDQVDRRGRKPQLRNAEMPAVLRVA